MSFCAVPAGTSKNLGANYHLNGQISSLANRGIDVTGDGYCAAACLTGIIQSAQNIGSPAAGRNADDQIAGSEFVGDQVIPAKVAAILSALYGLDESALATGDKTHDQIRGNAKGRRTLSGIQDTQPPAGTSTHVKDPAALLQSLDCPVHCLGDPGKKRIDGLRNFGILSIHGRDYFQRRHSIQIHGELVSLLRSHLI